MDTAGLYRAAPALRLERTLVVADDVDGSLLSAGCRTVDPDVRTDQIGLQIRTDAFVRIDQTPGPLFADLSVVENLILVLPGIRVGLGNLLFEPLVEGLVLPLTDQRE